MKIIKHKNDWDALLIRDYYNEFKIIKINGAIIEEAEATITIDETTTKIKLSKGNQILFNTDTYSNSIGWKTQTNQNLISEDLMHERKTVNIRVFKYEGEIRFQITTKKYFEENVIDIY